ncbi:MAG: hypothetical protein RLZZ540_3531 [Bacteroidota bacterium]|jgi:ABC-type bacteriocin/lantibiotic exporter with double-glycine peptidase domain
MKKLITICLVMASTFALQAQIKQQECPMCCWASCIQSCLVQANIYQEQSEIVSKVTGGLPANIPANANQVANVLKYYHFKAWVIPYPANEQVLLNTLASGWKIIAFVNPSNNPNIGHFIILQGVTPYKQIIISDPSNGQTYVQSPLQLYNLWNWGGSVVVGTPNGN